MRVPIIPAVLAAVLLAGCSTPYLRTQDSAIKEKEQVATDSRAKNTEIVEQAKARKSPAVAVSERAYLGAKPVPLNTTPKPPEFLSRRVELVQEVRSILELTETLSSIAKVPVTVRDDAMLVANRGGALYSIAPTAPTASGAPGQAVPQASAAPASASLIGFSHSGSLSSLLDIVAARFGVSWRYVPSGMIEFYHRDTRTFNVMVLPGDLSLTTEVGTAGTGGGTVAGSTTRQASQSTKATMDVKFWDSLKDAVNAIKSRDGVVSINVSAGTVTVTDTPSSLAQIGKLIEDQNALLSKQVLIEVKVVTLKLKDSETFGINWNLVYRSVQGEAAQFNKQSGVSALTSSDYPSIFRFDADPTGKMGGSNLVLQALAQQANIASITSAQQYALNNQATPIQVGRNTKFIESVDYTPATPTTAAVFAYKTGTLSDGVALQLVPRILDNQNLLLHLSADISDEPESLKLEQLSLITLYKQNVRNFMQRVALRSGETLVLSGYEKNTTNTDKRGLIKPDDISTGGLRDASSTREIVVILITPVIMDRVRS